MTPPVLIIPQDDVIVLERALYTAKFALEQDVDGPEKEDAIKKINEALDKLRRTDG